MQILSYDEAARRAGIVRRSLERLLAKGEGPAVVHISERRRGILETDLDAWLIARRRPAPGERLLGSETQGADHTTMAADVRRNGPSRAA